MGIRANPYVISRLKVKHIAWLFYMFTYCYEKKNTNMIDPVRSCFFFKDDIFLDENNIITYVQ